MKKKKEYDFKNKSSNDFWNDLIEQGREERLEVVIDNLVMWIAIVSMVGLLILILIGLVVK